MRNFPKGLYLSHAVAGCLKLAIDHNGARTRSVQFSAVQYLQQYVLDRSTLNDVLTRDTERDLVSDPDDERFWR